MKEVWLLAHEQQAAGKMYSWTVICWQLAWLRRQAAKRESHRRWWRAIGPAGRAEVRERLRSLESTPCPPAAESPSAEALKESKDAK